MHFCICSWARDQCRTCCVRVWRCSAALWSIPRTNGPEPSSTWCRSTACIRSGSLTSRRRRTSRHAIPDTSAPRAGHAGPTADLEAIRSRIQANPNATPNYTFLGDPSDAGLFPRIVRGEEKQWRVWEDEEHVAFLTPYPNTPGLTVLVPRKPLSSDIFRLEEPDYQRLVLASRKVSRLLEAGLGAWGVGLIFEGFEIDYAHAKLIPLISSADEAEMSLSCPAPEFFDRYPGYVTSVSGPPASRESLHEICGRVTRR